MHSKQKKVRSSAHETEFTSADFVILKVVKNEKLVFLKKDEKIFSNLPRHLCRNLPYAYANCEGCEFNLPVEG